MHVGGGSVTIDGPGGVFFEDGATIQTFSASIAGPTCPMSGSSCGSEVPTPTINVVVNAGGNISLAGQPGGNIAVNSTGGGSITIGQGGGTIVTGQAQGGGGATTIVAGSSAAGQGPVILQPAM